MEFKIKKSSLLESLVKLSGPSFENVIIEATDSLSISSSNDQTSVQALLDSDIKKEGSACVNFQKLLNFAKNYSAYDVKISTTKAGWVNVEGKHVKVRLPGIHKDNYPTVSFKDSDNTINIDGIKQAIPLVIGSVGQNKARESLTGIHIKVENKNASITAADSHVASRYYSTCDSEDCELLLTQKTAADIEKLIDDSCTLKHTDNAIMIESESMRYKSVLMGSPYPNIDRIIEHKAVNQIKVKKSGLNDIIGILTSVTAVSKDTIVKLVFENNLLTLKGQELDTGDGGGSVECEYTGEQIKIGVNIEMIKKIMQPFKGSDNEFITFGISGPELPIVLTDDTIENYRSVVMPVRIKW